MPDPRQNDREERNREVQWSVLHARKLSKINLFIWTKVSRLRREGRRRSPAGKREPKYMAKEQTFPTKQTDTGGYPWVPERHIRHGVH
jgi:hypothetical protein